MRYMTDVGSDLNKFLLQNIDRRRSVRIWWHLALHLCQPENKGSDLLKNAVVQFTGDAHSLRFLRFDQLLVQGADLIFGPLAVIDIDCAAIPPNHASCFILERPIMDKEPAILAVVPAHPLFGLKWNAAGEARLPLLPTPLKIAGMNKACPEVVVRANFVKGDA